MKEGDKVLIEAEWDTGELFGKIKGEMKYTLGAAKK